MKVKLLSRVRLFATPWTAAYQAPPSMGFSRQEYWSGVPLLSPVNLTSEDILPELTWEMSLWVTVSSQIAPDHFGLTLSAILKVSELWVPLLVN